MRIESQVAVKAVKKLDAALSLLVETRRALGAAEAQKTAQDIRCTFDGSQVEVIIEPALDGRADTISKSAIAALGGTVTGESKSLMRVKLPLDRLEQAASTIGGTRYIRPPLRPIEHAVTSEAVALTGADLWHSVALDGTGVKVAVIDGGFNGLAAAVTNGDIPATYTGVDETGDGLETGSYHGTAVGEAVCDMAPGVDLYLIKIGDSLDFENAKDYCIAQGVDVVNHSMGWTGASAFDGTGNICDIVSDASANGILWVNSAGNEARRHCQTVFDNGGGYTLDYSSLRTGAAGKPLTDFPVTAYGPIMYVSSQTAGNNISCFLTWDAWSESGQDYDLFLYSQPAGAWIACSLGDQTAGAAPAERISITVPTTGWYAFGVAKYSATRDHRLDLFIDSSDSYIEVEDDANRIAAGSCTDPAVSADAFAVGAIDEEVWVTGPQESFSSQGPTNGGLVKPDIAGPDNCDSSTWGEWQGTSQSSPHVAGAAALIKCTWETYTNTDIRNALEDLAIDMGAVGKDNVYGAGRLDLGATAPPRPIIWVDFAYVGYGSYIELGTETQPYNTLIEGVDAVQVDGLINIKTGTTDETIDITKEVTINAIGGEATVGAP